MMAVCCCGVNSCAGSPRRMCPCRSSAQTYWRSCSRTFPWTGRAGWEPSRRRLSSTYTAIFASRQGSMPFSWLASVCTRHSRASAPRIFQACIHGYVHMCLLRLPSVCIHGLVVWRHFVFVFACTLDLLVFSLYFFFFSFSSLSFLVNCNEDTKKNCYIYTFKVRFRQLEYDGFSKCFMI